MGNLNKILVGTVLVALLLSLPLSVFAQTTATFPTPQQFTLQYDNNSRDYVITIKNIDFDPPTGYDVHYNIRIHEDNSLYGNWYEAFYDEYPVQDPSGYTTIKLYDYNKYETHRFECEVFALMCHYEMETVYAIPVQHIGDTLNVTKVDLISDYSSPQSITVYVDNATDAPNSVEPDPIQTTAPSTQNPQYTQTPTPYPQYTQYPTATSNIWDNQLTALFNSHWEMLALLAMAVIIVVLAVGLVLVWRKVGNLADQKHPQENST